MGATEHCCVKGCGRALPNRAALGGRCAEPACNQAFCRYHWRHSNRRCPEHGYEETSRPGGGGEEEEQPASKETVIVEPESTPPTPETAKARKFDLQKAKQLAQDTGRMLQRLGAGAMALIRKFKKDRSPQGMLAAVQESLATNRKAAEELQPQVQALYDKVARLKAAWQKAPPALKPSREKELQTALREFKSRERELLVWRQQEQILTGVEGRIREIMAYGKAGVSEDVMDRLIDEIEDKAEEAEGLTDADRDLERAGKRRERESDKDTFLEALEGFGESEAAGEESPAAEAPPHGEPETKEKKREENPEVKEE